MRSKEAIAFVPYGGMFHSFLVMFNNMTPVAGLFPLVLLLSQLVTPARAAVACTQTPECSSAFLEGSICVNGSCTNPFYNGGCLRRMLPGWKKTRTCSSGDPPSTVEMGYCQPSPFDYMEIRIATENWESSFFSSWLLQIILSEMLDVPVSIETGYPGLSDNFYSVNSSMDYGMPIDWPALVRGAQVGDCRLLQQSSDPANYQSCAHFYAEGWQEDLVGAVDIYEKMGAVEGTSELGVLGAQRWFIPLYTLRRDPTLMSFVGLQGELNRRKLAETFLRPTSWQDYCEQVSNSTCRKQDGAATRAPANDDEMNSYYVKGLYTGHFRATEKNDCDKYPSNCTGHIADYPCGWTSYTKQQTYWLDIALDGDGAEENGGYSSEHLRQIWLAANATKSNVMMMWWYPELLYQQCLGSDAEFFPVILPTPTQECFDNRADPALRCSGNVTAVRGDATGACDYAVQSVQKVMGGSLYKTLYESGISEALLSPAYHALMNYKITELQLGTIFAYWQQRNIDPWNFDPREATCQWAVENIALLKSFIPESYPRALIHENITNSKFFVPTIVVGSVSIVLLVICSVGTYLKRKKKVIYRVQVPLLSFFLSGLLIVSVGALLVAVPANDASCISVSWLTNLGYGMAVVPLYVRVRAINRLLRSGRHMQRVRLTKETLVRWVLAVCCLLVALLVLWTVLGDPKTKYKYQLTSGTTSDGETIVYVKSYCASNSPCWLIIGVGWQTVLSMFALVLAFTASAVQEDVNEARLLAITFLSLFVFAVLRLAIVLVRSSMDPESFAAIFSLFYSADCIVAVTVFLVPKLIMNSDDQDTSDTGPDLFIETTIFFAEVMGFTAWSSVREPAQVFKFLDIVYGAFDDLADKRKVFKVETVGDCYVAATGIPNARSDHALLMARFARDCLVKMQAVAHEQEIVFGPDTGNLSLRIGIHSGPVTGGFLKGKGARFQLFGGTMNTAGLVLRAGEQGRIHVSEETANLLIEAGKTRWVEKRENTILTAKGEMQTYWLNNMHGAETSGEEEGGSSRCNSSDVAENDLWQISHDEKANKKRRLIDWNVEVLHGLLRQIVARRMAVDLLPKGSSQFKKKDLIDRSSDQFSDVRSDDSSRISFNDIEANGLERPRMPLDEVREIIVLPEFDHRVVRKQKDPENIVIPPIVLDQLKYYVTTAAEMYRDNPFHNFDHASHVVMAVIKLMNRIIRAKDAELGSEEERYFDNGSKIALALHDHTYGITSDPLTQFACIFSALIHDLDHPGVPNTQLIKEDKKLAVMYQSRSVAEQNSFDLAWNLLMEDQFKELRAAICGNNDGLARFRQLVINSIMATDLGDKELKALRNSRWEKAFSVNEDEISVCSAKREAINRKATIVIEHLIQASDVSHTMQHWEIYREWNENLFREMYHAYRQGRAEKNPADFWYEGEIGFFDYYIIPLSKKLSECGVFGVSSDENLNYAKENREEWVAKGRQVTAEMLRQIEVEYDQAVALPVKNHEE